MPKICFITHFLWKKIWWNKKKVVTLRGFYRFWVSVFKNGSPRLVSFSIAKNNVIIQKNKINEKDFNTFSIVFPQSWDDGGETS